MQFTGVIGAGVSMDLDVSILSLSTAKSLLPHSCTIPHVPQVRRTALSPAPLISLYKSEKSLWSRERRSTSPLRSPPRLASPRCRA